MRYNMSLLRVIKLHQLLASSVELKFRGDDIIWDNGVIEPSDHYIDYEIVYNLKVPSYSDYSSTTVFYLIFILGSNFFIQTRVTDTKNEP
jgi:hypothetical protein